MSRNWRSRTLGIVGVGALVVGAGLVVTSPASAAAVGDADALRSAISDLNGTGPAAEIELVPGATYSLPGSAGCDEEQDNASGDLDILRSNALKIYTPDGAAPAVLEMTCDAEKTPQRVIKMLPARADDDLRDQRSLTAAAAVSVGKLTLRNVVVRNGHAPSGILARGWGGAVLSVGDVSLENVRMESNTAGVGIAGNAEQPDGQGGGSGGAVFALGSVHVEGSTLTGNRAGRGGNGLSRAADGCDSQAGGNGGPGGSGGAVLALGGLDIVTSTFSGNTSGAGGNGGNGCDGFGNVLAGSNGGNGGPGGSGGAIQCGIMLIDDEVRDQAACAAAAVVKSSTLSGNTTGNGGTGGNGGDAISNAPGGNGGRGGSFELNALGGAIMFVGKRVESGPTMLTVENSTVDTNSSGNGGPGGNGGRGGDSVTGGPGGDGGAAGDGGNGGQGGAIVAAFADRTKTEVAHLVHATVTDNGGGGQGGPAGTPGEPGAGGGGDALAPAAEAAALGEPGATGEEGEDKGGSVLLFPKWSSLSTVIGTSSPATDGPDCWGSATTATFSRSTDADTEDSGCGFGAANQLAFDTFGLGALADNGGPTMTRLPSATSSLVDKVTGVEGQVVVDQRGVTRPQAAGADIGAVELQLIDMTLTKTASATSVVAGTSVTFTIVARGTGTSSPQPGVVIDDPKCTGLTAATGDTNANSTLDPTEAFTYTCTATPTEVGTFTNTVKATVTDGAGVKISRTASVDVAVTAPAGTPGTPPLANTGVNDPTPMLMTGAWLITGGALLLYFGRPKRVRMRRLVR